MPARPLGFRVALFRSLRRAQRERTFSHPEYGELTVEWVLRQLAVTTSIT